MSTDACPALLRAAAALAPAVLCLGCSNVPERPSFMDPDTLYVGGSDGGQWMRCLADCAQRPSFVCLQMWDGSWLIERVSYRWVDRVPGPLSPDATWDLGDSNTLRVDGHPLRVAARVSEIDIRARSPRGRREAWRLPDHAAP